ncbi:pentapeptide repeat-containing protein, partial [Frankia sp. R82]|uniref:pentapeptide repeat-containing protein n=1 Tax=Frankia sp. R82 TaxID=2950553 RepID=UPI0020447775
MRDDPGALRHHDFLVCYADNADDRQWAAWIAWTLRTFVRPPIQSASGTSAQPGSTPNDTASENPVSEDGASQPGGMFDVFLDEWENVAGTNVVQRMDGAMRRAKRVVVVLSQAFVAQSSPDASPGTSLAPLWSAWQQDPQGTERRLLPVRVDDCTPDGLLRPLQYIDLAGLTRDEAISRLRSEIHATLDGHRRPRSEPLYPGPPAPRSPDLPAPPFPGPSRKDSLGNADITAGHEATGPQSTTNRSGAALPDVSHLVGPRFDTELGDGIRRGDAAGRHAPMVRLEEITRLRFPRAQVQLIPADAQSPAHLWIQERDPVGRTVKGVVLSGEQQISTGTLNEIAKSVRHRYPAGPADPTGPWILVVCPGNQVADEALRRHAAGLSMAVQSLIEYEMLMDLREYVARQTDVLKRDRLYPPALYVRQRMTRIGAPRRALDTDGLQPPTTDDALDEVLSWLSIDGPRFALLLGNAGRGKTFLMHELARVLPDRLPHLTPMLLELRDLDKTHNLDQLVASHLAGADEVRFDLDAFHYLLRQGRIALLFDGYDELAVRISYARAAEHLATLLNAAEGNAKVVVTSRSEHFLSDQGARTALGSSVERITGSRLARMEGFTQEQIEHFLIQRYRAEHSSAAKSRPSDAELDRLARADARQTLDLLAELESLAELAANPRMLSFIVGLGTKRLRAALRGQGDVTRAQLYREIVQAWLEYETRRAAQAEETPSMTFAQRRAAATKLALALWRSTEPTIGPDQLEETAVAVLATMGDQRGFDEATAAQLLGSGTLLIRDPAGRFSFIHASVMEYLVAEHTAAMLREDKEQGRWPVPQDQQRRWRDRFARQRNHGQPPTQTMQLLGQATLSAQTADFLVDLLDADVASELPSVLLSHLSATELARTNAVVLARVTETRLKRPARLSHAQLARQDLSGQDLSEQDLRGADLRGANLADSRLRGTDLTGADLTGATLSRAELHHACLAGAILADITALRSRWTDVDLTDTDLTGADFTGARFTDVDLLVAKSLADTRWTGALLLGGHAPQLPSLEAIAFARQAPAQPMIAPPISMVQAVAFSPDGLLLAICSESAVLIADAQDGPLLRVFTGHTGTVYAVAFSPDGHTLATGADDGTVRLWDTGSGQTHTTLTGHTSTVWAVAFSPDGHTLATGADDGTVRLWDTG